MNLAEKWQQQGIQKGLQEGRQEGRQETAKRMLARGMSCQVIQDITGLTAQQIERLQQEWGGE